jgi:hypothetical protein
MKNLLDQATPKLAMTPQKRIKMNIEEQEPWTGNSGIGVYKLQLRAATSRVSKFTRSRQSFKLSAVPGARDCQASH